MRHLVTDGVPTTRIDRHGLREWYATQGDRGIAGDAAPSGRLIDQVARSRHLVVSPLARAQATAAAVLARVPIETRPVVCSDREMHEAPLPVLPVSRVRLSLDSWDVACRAVWLLGYSADVESRRASVARAGAVAGRLADLASSGDVTAVGHGFLNVLARELHRRGWRGPRIPDVRNGATTTYRRPRP